MSSFAVEVREIGTIVNHPNADRLDLATVTGMDYQFVVARESFKPGDRCVYFPLDAILPPDLCTHLGFEGKLSGPHRNRVKTVRLRGEPSQGLAVRLDAVSSYFAANHHSHDLLGPLDLTALLGVGKYEPEPIPCHAGNLVHLPPGQEVYDIEGCDRHPGVPRKLIAEKIRVRILEKLEGTNFSITAGVEGKLWVCQRNNAIEEIPEGTAENMFWRVARRRGLVDLIRRLVVHHQPLVPGLARLVLRGELIGPGVQKNLYALKDTTVGLFDLEIITATGRRTYQDWQAFKDALARFDALSLLAPIIAEDVLLDEWLAGRTLREACHGPSALNPRQFREGIVITPLVERYDEELGGRLIIKQRDPIYLGQADC